MTDIFLRYRTEGQERRRSDRDNDDYQLIVTRDGERVRVMVRAKKPMTLISCSFKKPFHYRKGDQIFLNGYQTWTDTREYELSEEVHSMNRVPRRIKQKYHFEMYGDSWFWKYHKKSCHSFTYSYVRRKSGKSMFIGSLADDSAYLIIHHKKDENEMSIRSDCEHRQLEALESFVLYDFVYYEGDVQENLNRYFDHFGTCTAPQLRGYTSWYLDYQDINEEKMRAALAQTDPDEFDLFQIDDGYETYVGDWLDIDPVKFPNGLDWVVEEAHEKGLKAGIWLAPFVCEIDSSLYKEHPDWIFRESGKEVFAGSNWSGDVTLDIRKSEVRDYIRTCLEAYKNMGFDFFKLDFLYAAALISTDDRLRSDQKKAGADAGWYGITRAQMMRKGMQFLRDTLGGRLILGCGVPLSSAFNLVDYCRIGPDISLTFDDVLYMRLMHRERISTKNALQNTIYRSVMDGKVFRCDPDVFLLRDDHISLTREQRKALAVLNHLCGSVWMTSDHVGEYDEEKRRILAHARSLEKAVVTGIRKEKDIIYVQYSTDGSHGELAYNRRKGILV